MKYNFDDYLKAKYETKWDISIDDLDQEDIDSLKEIVGNWSEADIEKAKDVLHDNTFSI